MKILLVEPNYKNKYPPLGLMKISAYHKDKGDEVVFVKGFNKELKEQKWDRIYITTLFTFHWVTTIKTINYYIKSVVEKNNFFIGGILATLLFDELSLIENFNGVTILRGLLDEPGILGDDNIIIDRLTPDYDIIDSTNNKYLNYEYKVKNSYIMSTTKGCIRKCEFCAVKTLEPNYLDYIDIKKQIKEINDKYGTKRDLMLMDNNVLASKSLEQIVNDLIEIGFGRGNKSYLGNSNRYLTRHIDFNQGTDARLINERTIKLLSSLEIKPLRIAFDHADDQSIIQYTRALQLAADYDFYVLSNYVLFNFKDKPFELYKRLKINIDLNEEFSCQGKKTRIWSFPMKYMPLQGEHSKDRKYIGDYWNAKLLRGIQCLLIPTHGVIGPHRSYFEHAFGHNYEEFITILYMPENYIIYRETHISNGNINMFTTLFNSLDAVQKNIFLDLIKNNIFIEDESAIEDVTVRMLYSLYK